MKQEKKCCWSFQWIGASKITSGCVVSLTVISNRWEYVLLAGKKNCQGGVHFDTLIVEKKMTRDRGDKASYHSWRSSKEIQFDSRYFSLYRLMRLDDFFSIRKFRMFEKLLRTFLETTEVTDFTTLGINESTANDACSGIKLYICKLIDRTVNQIKVVQSCTYK